MYKVLIADDEPVIRKGLQCFVNWQSLDCSIVGMVSNGLEAKEFLDCNSIDIVITDIKMPGMDGIKLAEYIYQNHPHIKVIILTAFADFCYAQSSIKYNVVDFVVKTNPSDKIPQAINKAKQMILQEKENEHRLEMLELKINTTMPEIREKFLKEVLNGIVTENDEIESKMLEYGIEPGKYFVLVFETESNPLVNFGDSTEEKNKTIFSVRNFLSLALKDFHHYIIIMSQNQFAALVSFPQTESSFNCTQAILLTCNDLLKMVDNFMKFNICIGISSMQTGFNSINSAFIEAQKALSMNFYSDNNVSVYYPSQCNNIPLAVDTYRYTDEIINNIQSGEVDAAIFTLNNLFKEFRNNKESIDKIKISSIILCSSCVRLLANCRLNLYDNTNKETEIYKKIQESKSIQSLSEILEEIVISVSQALNTNEKQYSSLIRKVNLFIQNNYNKVIDLQVIADHIHVNKSYLSRLYKKETGEPLIDTINNYRISVAKKLLKDTDKKIFEIASDVGIEDAAYFTHVFIKYTGISPKEYKGRG